MPQAENQRIVQALREMAVLLESQGDNPYRVAAYRRAADLLAQLPRALRDIHQQQGEAGLDALPGVGPRIAKAITEMLDRQRAWRGSRPATAAAGLPEPPVVLLFDVDREYRERAQAGTLPTIAPKRFNPEGKAWLPVLPMLRPPWHLSALFSNTARAHELGRVHDWVVLYAEHEQHHEHQYTVVTATRGALVGQRVVRGREAECCAQHDGA